VTKSETAFKDRLKIEKYEELIQKGNDVTAQEETKNSI